MTSRSPQHRAGSDAPRAARRPTRLERHGVVREDPYYWLRERDDPEVRAYLEAENEHFEAYLDGRAALVEEIYGELETRIAVDDSTVPVVDGAFEYFAKIEGRQAHRDIWRQPVGGGEAELVLDVNALAEGQPFCQVAAVAPSPDARHIAYCVDLVGRRQFSLHVRDLRIGEDRQVVDSELAAAAVWSSDGRGLFALHRDLHTLRARWVRFHSLNGDPPILAWDEADDTFHVSISRSKSRELLLVHCEQTLHTEIACLPLARPKGPASVLVPRELQTEAFADHAAGRFWVRTNDLGPNYRLVSAATESPHLEWTEEIAHREEVLLEDFEVLSGALVSLERRDARPTIQVRPFAGDSYELEIEEPASTLHFQGNREEGSSVLRYGMSSLRLPMTVVDINLETGQRRVRKTQPVGGAFDADDYVTERLDVRAPDGALVPVSLVARRDLAPGECAPLLLSGYGAYGASSDPSFRASILSLLDRGYRFAIAHVRGGMERGYSWYVQGRQLQKKNTFTDFVAVAEHFVETGLTRPSQLAARGGSAGGLLMGAVLNLRPDLFAAVLAAVPFVDVVTTMLDESIPLTTGEYDEWGDPREREAFDYILSYSPYDNVESKDYPALLVTAGFHDSQVQYWEPAKWVARLRERATGNREIFLRTNFDAGHGGAAGRFDQLRETAIELAFLVDRVAAGGG